MNRKRWLLGLVMLVGLAGVGAWRAVARLRGDDSVRPSERQAAQSGCRRNLARISRPMPTTSPTLVLCDFPANTGDPRWASFSPFVVEVDRALRIAKLPFRREQVPITKIKKLNPTGQLPVLLVDQEPVADSTLILHRIEILAPGSMTGGLDARGVAEAWLWEEFADTALYPHVLTARWADERGWPVPRKAFFGGLPPVIRDLVASVVRRKTLQALVGRDFTRAGLGPWEARLQRVLDALEARAPESGFWLGPKPSAADIGLFGHLHALRLPQLPWRKAEVDRRARLSRWLDRVEAA
jgi:glutathione S-transferase